MRSFLMVWLVAFGLVAAVASGMGWYVVQSAPPPTPAVSRQPSSFESATATSGPFLEAEAIDIITQRLPIDAAGEQARQKLQNASTVTYHSAQHWRICFEDACWVAHGPGRYAEPENDAARQHETRRTLPR